MKAACQNRTFLGGAVLVASIGFFGLAVRTASTPSSPQQDVAATAADCRNSSPQNRETEKNVMVFANQERQKAGVVKLQWSDALADAARYHSCRMMALDFLDHIDPELGELGQRLRVAGLDISNVGENIFKGKGSDPARHSIDAWMKSPHHRDNLLDPKYRWTGVGFSAAADGHYWFTQDFSASNPLPKKETGDRRQEKKLTGSAFWSYSVSCLLTPVSFSSWYTTLPPTIVVAT